MDRKPGLKKIITVSLGGLWLVDGILQFQPAMFTGSFVNAVLAPNLQNQPGVIAGVIAFGIRIWSASPVWSNFASALIQVLIGVLLVFPFRTGAQKFGLWLSVAWALVIWVFGEGFGNLATGSASFYTGAPGSALLYLVIALSLLYGFHKKLPLIAGIFFILGALLNLTPMFWQPTMLSMLAMIPSISGPLGAVGAQGTIIGNFLAVDLLVFLGIFLVFVPNKTVAWTAILFLLAVWSVSQDFGGILTFPFGTATDPNSAPLFILFLLPAFFSGNIRARD